MQCAARLREDNVAAMYMPAENYLRRGFGILCGKLCYKRVAEKFFVAVSQRIPGFYPIPFFAR